MIPLLSPVQVERPKSSLTAPQQSRATPTPQQSRATPTPQGRIVPKPDYAMAPPPSTLPMSTEQSRTKDHAPAAGSLPGASCSDDQTQEASSHCASMPVSNPLEDCDTAPMPDTFATAAATAAAPAPGSVPAAVAVSSCIAVTADAPRASGQASMADSPQVSATWAAISTSNDSTASSRSLDSLSEPESFASSGSSHSSIGATADGLDSNSSSKFTHAVEAPQQSRDNVVKKGKAKPSQGRARPSPQGRTKPTPAYMIAPSPSASLSMSTEHSRNTSTDHAAAAGSLAGASCFSDQAHEASSDCAMKPTSNPLDNIDAAPTFDTFDSGAVTAAATAPANTAAPAPTAGTVPADVDSLITATADTSVASDQASMADSPQVNATWAAISTSNDSTASSHSLDSSSVSQSLASSGSSHSSTGAAANSPDSHSCSKSTPAVEAQAHAWSSHSCEVGDSALCDSPVPTFIDRTGLTGCRAAGSSLAMPARDDAHMHAPGQQVSIRNSSAEPIYKYRMMPSPLSDSIPQGRAAAPGHHSSVGTPVSRAVSLSMDRAGASSPALLTKQAVNR